MDLKKTKKKEKLYVSFEEGGTLEVGSQHKKAKIQHFY